MRKLTLLTLSFMTITAIATPKTALAATYQYNCNSSNNGYYVITEQKNSDSTCNIDINELLSNITEGNQLGGVYYWSNCYGTNIPGLDQFIPELPEIPVIPETPALPGTPVTPENPELPMGPSTPETPEKPEVPEAPETPEVPVTPEIPEISVTPPAEQPEEGIQTPEQQVPSTPEVNQPENDKNEANTELSFAEQVVALVNDGTFSGNNECYLNKSS